MSLTAAPRCNGKIDISEYRGGLDYRAGTGTVHCLSKYGISLASLFLIYYYIFIYPVHKPSIRLTLWVHVLLQFCLTFPGVHPR